MRETMQTDDWDDLVDIREIFVRKDLPKEERIAAFVEQIKNPYRFRCGDLKGYIDNVVSLEAMLSNIDQESINREHAREYAEHIAENERQLEKTLHFKANLYESLVDGAVTREEYASYHRRLGRPLL